MVDDFPVSCCFAEASVFISLTLSCRCPVMVEPVIVFFFDTCSSSFALAALVELVILASSLAPLFLLSSLCVDAYVRWRSGIGKQTCLLFAREGADVLGADVTDAVRVAVFAVLLALRLLTPARGVVAPMRRPARRPSTPSTATATRTAPSTSTAMCPTRTRSRPWSPRPRPSLVRCGWLRCCCCAVVVVAAATVVAVMAGSA